MPCDTLVRNWSSLYALGMMCCVRDCDALRYTVASAVRLGLLDDADCSKIHLCKRFHSNESGKSCESVSVVGEPLVANVTPIKFFSYSPVDCDDLESWLTRAFIAMLFCGCFEAMMQ